MSRLAHQIEIAADPRRSPDLGRHARKQARLLLQAFGEFTDCVPRFLVRNIT